MKIRKKIFYSVAIATILCMLNWLCIAITSDMPGIVIQSGCELEIKVGLGAVIYTYYPFGTVIERIPYSKYWFDPLSYVVSIGVVFGIIMAVSAIYNKIKAKRINK